MVFTIQQSLIFWLTFFTCRIHLSVTKTVHIKYMSTTAEDDSMPDQLNVVIHGKNMVPISLQLVEKSKSDIPIYKLKISRSGRVFKQLEQLEDNENIGFYQDQRYEAFMQVTVYYDLWDNGMHFELKGELLIRKRLFSLTPVTTFKENQTSLPHSLKNVPYNLSPINESGMIFDDDTNLSTDIEEYPEDLDLERSSSAMVPRRSKGTRTQIFIEVVAIIDYVIYSRFLAKSGTKKGTLQAIREHYSLLFSGIDLRYKDIVHSEYSFRVRLSKLIIAETVKDSPFTELYQRGQQIDAESVLWSLQRFASGMGKKLLSPYDHAMLFTGYDLTGPVGNSVVGKAYLSGLCDSNGFSVSVIEDRGDFTTVDAASHELGHNLGSRHDGDSNSCSSSDNFLMTSGFTGTTENTKLNPWKFSRCSIDYIVKFVNNELKYTRGKECLLQALPILDIPDMSKRLPGQEMSVDEQCKARYGKMSSMCRSISPASDICTKMFCSKGGPNICAQHRAAMGTTCGNRKMCMKGECVQDSRAPAADDNCLFGDVNGIAVNGKTCVAIVKDFRGYCYQPSVAKICCATCKANRLDITNCLFGDKAYGCSPIGCKYGSNSYRQSCCGTCRPNRG